MYIRCLTLFISVLPLPLPPSTPITPSLSSITHQPSLGAPPSLRPSIHYKPHINWMIKDSLPFIFASFWNKTIERIPLPLCLVCLSRQRSGYIRGYLCRIFLAPYILDVACLYLWGRRSSVGQQLHHHHLSAGYRVCGHAGEVEDWQSKRGQNGLSSPVPSSSLYE